MINECKAFEQKKALYSSQWLHTPGLGRGCLIGWGGVKQGE